MGDSYAEYLVKKRVDSLAAFFRIMSIVITIVVSYITLRMIASLLPFVILIFSFLISVIYRNTDVEYEFAFINGQMDVDCIYGKKKRKLAKSFDFKKLEVLAPISHQKILAYEHRKDITDFNYTSGYPDTDIYVAILVGKSGNLGRLYFEPSEEMLTAIAHQCGSRVIREVE